jgi:hypothetical protein
VAEEWHGIPGFPAYQMERGSGTVRSVPRRLPDGRWHGGTLLVPYRGRRYWTVTLYRDGTRATLGLHVLSALTFHGERPPGHQVLHRNDDQTRNGADDVRYGSPRRNVLERKRRERKNRSYRRNRVVTYRVGAAVTPVTRPLSRDDAA